MLILSMSSTLFLVGHLSILDHSSSNSQKTVTVSFKEINPDFVQFLHPVQPSGSLEDAQ